MSELPWEYVAPLFLALLSLGLGLSLLRRQKGLARKPSEARESAGYSFLVLSALSGAWMGILASVAKQERWVWLLGAVPALLVITHAMFIYLVRGKSMPDGHNQDWIGTERPKLKTALGRLDPDARQHFSVSAMVLRFIAPAIVLGALPIVLFRTLGGMDGVPPAVLAKVPPAAIEGAKYAAVGAYVFVLLNIGRRAIQSDVTAGTVTWSVVTLAVGPLVGGVLSLVLRDTSAVATDTSVTREAALFMAGFSPKLVVDFLEVTVRRLFAGPSSPAAAGRVVPLSLVRGISRVIEERLEEEGIDDAHALAMASPFRLMRNTAYDRRQILAWIDSALLVTTLPESWQALERAGITGAIDLAWCAPTGVESSDSAGAGNARIVRLAAATKLDVETLTVVAERLSEDSQVQLIWVMYQIEGSERESTEGSTNAGDTSPLLDPAAVEAARREASLRG